MRAVISVANVARGVGKTATAVSLAAELALRGFETLLIDADPQAEATARLVEPQSVGLSVADLMLTPDPPEEGATAEGTRLGVEDVLVQTAVPRLRLAPSSIRLAAGEGDTPLDPDVLHSLLMALEHPCDFAVIDTPSSLGPITAACLCASTHLLAPVAPGTRGAQGLRHSVDGMGNMPCGRVELLGVVCNLFDCRSHASGAFYEGLRREWGNKVAGTIIHRDDKIEISAGLREPVQAYAPASAAATLYAELADELLPRLGVASSLSKPAQ